MSASPADLTSVDSGLLELPSALILVQKRLNLSSAESMMLLENNSFVLLFYSTKLLIENTRASLEFVVLPTYQISKLRNTRLETARINQIVLDFVNLHIWLKIEELFCAVCNPVRLCEFGKIAVSRNET